jgi:hypothetical protein
MKLKSKYFDSIRVARKQERAKPVREEYPCCQWKGCKAPGRHRAPKGRGRDGEYFFFCLDHVRQYNASYNYFDGMNDAEVEDFQKENLTGHRPTWKVGANAEGQENPPGAKPGAARPLGERAVDPHGFFAWRAKAAREEPIRSGLLTYKGMPRVLKSKRDSKNSLSFITPMRMVGTSALVTSCAKLSKPITI